MNETKMVICMLAALFLLMLGVFLTANLLAKRFTDGWLALAAAVFGMLAITCFAAAQTRARNDRRLSDAEHERKMDQIRAGNLE
jgi:accessory gene regulator protein AgrB